MEKIKQVVPSNCVKSFGDVKLYEEGRGLAAVKPASGVPDIHEVVMNGSGFDESTLTARHKNIHLWTKPTGHSFGDDLWDCVNETDGPEISDGPICKQEPLAGYGIEDNSFDLAICCLVPRHGRTIQTGSR